MRALAKSLSLTGKIIFTPAVFRRMFTHLLNFVPDLILKFGSNEIENVHEFSKADCTSLGIVSKFLKELLISA